MGLGGVVLGFGGDGFWGVNFGFGEGRVGFVECCVGVWGLVGHAGALEVVFGDWELLFVVGRADFGLGRAGFGRAGFGLGLGNVLGLGHGLGHGLEAWVRGMCCVGPLGVRFGSWGSCLRLGRARAVRFWA